MLRPLVGVSISASRTALADDLEEETRSSRIMLQPPEVLVVLEQGTNVAKLSTKFITVEGSATATLSHPMPNAASLTGLVQTQHQFADGLASTIFHKLRSGDEVVTVAHGPSGCGKTTSIFGASIDPTTTRKAAVGETGGGLFWDVATRIFSLAGGAVPPARSPSSSASGDVPSSGLPVVEVAIGCIEYRPTTGSSGTGDDDDTFLQEEAVDLIKDMSDCTTPCGCFAAHFTDVPLSHYVVCRDVSEIQTVMLVALSRSLSWVPDGSVDNGDNDDCTRLEMPHRPSPDSGSNTGPQPLVPAVGGRSHINVNLLVRVVHPLDGADAVSAERRNRALNIADGEPMPSLVTTKTTCSVWRLFDLMGPQLYDFDANASAEMSCRSQRALLEYAMAPLVPSSATAAVVPSTSGRTISTHAESAEPSPPSLFDPRNGSLCVEVIASLLRCGTTHVVWMCALRQDYAFDHLNAEGVRLAAWVSDRCGRPVALDERRRSIRDKHLHVARKVIECHALPASVFFLEVMDLRRSTAGARYASLAHQLALNAAFQPSRGRLPSTGGGEWSQAAVSPQSISLDNNMTTHGEVTSTSEGEGFWASARSTSNDTLTSSFHKQKRAIAAAPRESSAGAGSGIARRSSGDAPRGAPSFVLEVAPETRQLPNVTGRAPQEPAQGTVELASGSESEGAVARDSAIQHDAAALAASAAARSHRTAVVGQVEPKQQWDAVLRQFRSELSATTQQPEGVVENREKHLSRPSRGGTVPRYFHRRSEDTCAAATTTHVLQQQQNDGDNTFYPSSCGSSSTYERVDPLRCPDDNSSQPHRVDAVDKSDIVEALQEEVMRLNSEVDVLRSQQQQQQQQPPLQAGDPAVATLIEKMVQPVLARLEEESAALRARLLQSAVEDGAAWCSRDAAQDTGACSDSDEVHGSNGSTHVDDPLRPVKAAMKLNTPVKRSIHQQHAESRRGVLSAKREAAASIGVGDASARNASTLQRSVLRHDRSGQGTISASDVHNALELQRRVRFLERQLAESQQHNLNVRREVMDAAQQSIAAHKDAFSKILNESGTMYARLHKAYQDTNALQRDTALRLQRTSEEQLVLEEKLTVSRAIESDLRRTVAQLQREKAGLLRQDALQQAVTSVASVFANASQSECGSGSVRHATAPSDGRQLFDASLLEASTAASLPTNRHRHNDTLDASHWSSSSTHGKNAMADSNASFSVGFLTFQQSVHNLVHAATAPFAAMEGVLNRTTDTLQRVQALRSDPVANQCFKELRLAVRDMEHKRLQATLHASLVKEELGKLDAQWREMHQRERQYLNVLVSR